MTYKTTFERRPDAAQHASRSLGRGERIVREIEAVKHVSFSIPHGTVLGIVGANGAGKSTLVRTIAGILPPTEGRIDVYGRVSTLLALGVGFNKNLTGRDNVRLGGLAAGLHRDAARREVRGHRAPSPSWASSWTCRCGPTRSGMYGRLAFSVAVNMDPDILLIDEALSVGDARFRRKSANKMRELCGQARTIVLVCTRSARSASCATRRSGSTTACCGCGTSRRR